MLSTCKNNHAILYPTSYFSLTYELFVSFTSLENFEQFYTLHVDNVTLINLHEKQNILMLININD